MSHCDSALSSKGQHELKSKSNWSTLVACYANSVSWRLSHDLYLKKKSCPFSLRMREMRDNCQVNVNKSESFSILQVQTMTNRRTCE